MVFRAIVILVLAGAIFGGAAFFAYELYWKPQKLDREEKREAANRPAPTPPPDYTLPAFQKAIEQQKNGDPESARAALEDFLKSYPASSKAGEARRILGETNARNFFSASEGDGKVAYTVVSRDSLAKISGKFKTNAELIFRVNNLESINLQIGQQLFIPQPDITITVNSKEKTVTLMNKGRFFREYPALSVKVSKPTAGPMASHVVDKIAMRDSKRVAFGDKNYADSDRSVMLTNGIAIRGVPEGTQGPYPAGIVVAVPDMDEIFLLASRNNPVTIQ